MVIGALFQMSNLSVYLLELASPNHHAATATTQTTTFSEIKTHLLQEIEEHSLLRPQFRGEFAKLPYEEQRACFKVLACLQEVRNHGHPHWIDTIRDFVRRQHTA